MEKTACLNVDPDITGLGVRINLYATTLLVALLPRTQLTLPLLDVLITNGAISGFALLVTAIIRTAQHQLTLYHAIFILHMLFFLGIGLFPSGRYKHTSYRGLLTLFLSISIIFMFQGWALYVWATAPVFGSADTRACNDHIKYIFVFVSVRATALWLRILWIVTLALGGLTTTVSLLSFLGGLILRVRDRVHSTIASTALLEGRESQIDLRNILLFSSSIYAVVMLELYVRRNKDLEISDGDELWTFGQILNIVMIVNTFNELVHFLLGFLATQSRTDSRSEEVPI